MLREHLWAELVGGWTWWHTGVKMHASGMLCSRCCARPHPCGASMVGGSQAQPLLQPPEHHGLNHAGHARRARHLPANPALAGRQRGQGARSAGRQASALTRMLQRVGRNGTFTQASKVLVRLA